MNHLSLCSGIGGLDLAAHMAGIETTAFCEIEKYPVEVLKLRFPGKPIINDIREVDGREFRGINVISGGFPCQPHSVAGKRKGSLDERHLFPEMARIVSEAQPEWFVGENVRGIFSSKDDGGCSGGVLADSIYRLSALGYAVGWCCYGSVDVGAPHRRDRIFILANRDPGKVKKVIEIVRGSLTPWQGDCWPTPVSSDGTVGSIISKDDKFITLPSGRLRKINRNGIDGSLGLARTLKFMDNLWPTPRANDSEKRGNIANDPRNGLPDSALWNTPKGQDSNDKSLPPSSLNRCSLLGDLARQKDLTEYRGNYILNKAKIKKDFGLTIPHWRDGLKKMLKNMEG